MADSVFNYATWGNSMTISAIKALEAWRSAISQGDVSDLDEMLAEDLVFENSEGNRETKSEVLEWAKAGGFAINPLNVYHEDENVICGTHTYEAEGEPNWVVMYFAKFENGKCTFWKVQGTPQT